MSSDAISPIKKRAKRKKSPRHALLPRSFKFPLEMSERDSGKLFGVVDVCWELRNQLAADRKQNRLANKELKTAGAEPKSLVYLTMADQYLAVAAYAKKSPLLAKIHSQVRQNVAKRIQDGYDRFFDGRKAGKNIGAPDFIERKKYRSFTYPQYGTAAHIKNGKLHLSGLGEFRVRDYRKIKGQKKSVTIKWQSGKWWVIVVAAQFASDTAEAPELLALRPDGGGDSGLAAILTTSDGVKYDMPQPLKASLKELRREQRCLARKFTAREEKYQADKAKATATGPLREQPYSKRLKAQIAVVGRLHTKVADVRGHRHKKIAAITRNKFNRFAMEEHGVAFMLSNRKMARMASDRGIHGLKLALKSALKDRYYPVGTARTGIGGNSQTCTCNAAVLKTLNERVHRCPACGLVADRDHVTSNIVQLTAFSSADISLSRCPGRVSSDVEIPKPEQAQAQPAGKGICRRRGAVEASASSIENVAAVPRVVNLPWKARQSESVVRRKGQPLPHEPKGCSG